MTDPLIRLLDVTKHYQMGEVTIEALRGLALSVDRGEFIVLLGPSGSGKTTTLNLIGGLDRPTSGHIFVASEDVTAYDDAQLTSYRRRQVGFVFQFYNLVPTLSAAENVEFALALTPHDSDLPAEARRLLALVGLETRADHFPAQLSGGEQQRVAIARALANRPPLLLCDEPTGNLDVETGQRVLHVLRDLNQQEGTTVLLVTHNSAIAPLADRVLHMQSGTIARDESNLQPRDVAELVW